MPDTKAQETAKPAAAPKKEFATNKEEWGEKYSDECLKFEKEWKVICDKIENEYALLLKSY